MSQSLRTSSTGLEEGPSSSHGDAPAWWVPLLCSVPRAVALLGGRSADPGPASLHSPTPVYGCRAGVQSRSCYLEDKIPCISVGPDAGQVLANTQSEEGNAGKSCATVFSKAELERKAQDQLMEE